ncbi:hypothetical protein GCM10010250_22150 [Streptomyces althioticus]|uniref:hypothetical protein n=1 Tax=Streptomyces althioticus TaxID=83380 RepID=UPI001875296B|nr:hypothetical protein GCM10010250_22150 [Streptomyces althioticus]
MADPVSLAVEATPAAAAPITGLIEEAGAAAAAHFEQLPDGEEGTALVTLTAATPYGSVPIGMWSFLRAADGTVKLAGAPEAGADG